MIIKNNVPINFCHGKIVQADPLWQFTAFVVGIKLKKKEREKAKKKKKEEKTEGRKKERKKEKESPFPYSLSLLLPVKRNLESLSTKSMILAV